MKKQKKQKKPSYKSLVFDLAQARYQNSVTTNDNYKLQREIEVFKERTALLNSELDDARRARENKMNQLGLYFAALNTFDAGDERLIQLQNELFDRPNYNPQDVAFTKPKNSDLF